MAFQPTSSPMLSNKPCTLLTPFEPVLHPFVPPLTPPKQFPKNARVVTGRSVNETRGDPNSPGGQGHVSTPTLDITIRPLNIGLYKRPCLMGVPGEGPPASAYVIIAPNEPKNKKSYQNQFKS